jgi:subtilisin family serine protease
MTDQPAQISSTSQFPRGCALALIYFFLGGWNLLVAAVMIGWNGVLEQDWMMRVLPGPDRRWLLALGLGLSTCLPAALAAWLVREPTLRRAARVLALGGLLALFLAPSRLAGIQQSQLGAVFQLGGVAAFGFIVWLVERSYGRRLQRPSWGGLGWALAIGTALGVPWALWGALGSPLDTLLALLVALCVAVCFVFAWDISRSVETVPPAYAPFLLDGLLGALAFLPICAGLGANGSAAMLVLAIPWLAWPAASLVSRDRLSARTSWPAAVLLIALGLFWPLACVDLEELSILLSDVGEASRWIWTAGGLSAVLAAGSVVAAVLLHRFWLRHRILNFTGWVLGSLTGSVLLLVYFISGQPGFYGERLFVILKDQADLSFAEAIRDPQERRAEVYNRLVAHADRTQASLRAELDARGLSYTSYYLVNAIEVQGDPLFTGWLEARPEVDRVLIDTRLRPLPQPLTPSGGGASEPDQAPGWNLQLIHADRVWRDLGVTGAGILVGQSDSGVDGSHPELLDSYRKLGPADDYSWFDPWNGSTSPVDVGGHGTHTLSTVLGNRVGVAPDAKWIACVNLGRNLGNPAFYLDCMQFNFAPFPQGGDPLRDGKPEYGAQVLNNSWGCPPIEGCDPGTLQSGAAALRAAGIFVAVSAGNDGDSGCGTVVDPLALYAEVFSVGAVDSNGDLASFSSLGPVSVDGSQRLKPDVVAPGVDVLSAFPGREYASFSGTSMAGPHVAGVVALIWSANPDLIGDIERTEQILRDTARPYTGLLPACVLPGQPNNAAGYGLIDAYAAVQAALAIKE